VAPSTRAVKVVPRDPAKANYGKSGVISRVPALAERIVPPIVVVTLSLLIWELVCHGGGATLPPPSKVVSSTWELIINPFYDHGGLDKGLFWHLLASLQRVGIGYVLASIVGIALGTLVGQSVWAMRGLDPLDREALQVGKRIIRVENPSVEEGLFAA